ncbi:DUF1214 domain-containing protein [Mycobacterium sp. EPa45]|uniref:DUF1214 domain-containing protein n=1 Tax=Mycobacterium sp. EPa45 TaxID=1545728 RepID=UPI0011876020
MRHLPPRPRVDTARNAPGHPAEPGHALLPERDALYLNVVPPDNDGRVHYRLTLADVPVDGFWSVTVYDSDGYFTPNPQNAYSVNNITATQSADDKVSIDFGGDASAPNHLPITPGWNYLVRLSRPREVILRGQWASPKRDA